ncbi:MAG: hypothetical protein AAGA43_15650 [Bacteroidota bacterium]
MSTKEKNSHQESNLQTLEDDSKETISDIEVVDPKDLSPLQTNYSTKKIIDVAQQLNQHGKRMKFYDEKIELLKPVLEELELYLEQVQVHEPKNDFFERAETPFHYYLALIQGLGSDTSDDVLVELPDPSDRVIVEIPNPNIIKNIVSVLYGFVVESKQEEMEKIQELLQDKNLTLRG